MVWPRQKDARGENTKINYGLDTTGKKATRTSKKKNVDGRSTSSHDNKKLRTKSIDKQRGMAFGFRKMATALKKKKKKTGQIDRCIYNTQTVVKVLCYTSEGCWFDPSWCNWNFSLI